MTVFRPKGEPFFHVFFRLGGKQHNRSTGVADLTAAKIRGAEIFAEIVSRPKSVAQTADLQSVIDELRGLVTGQPFAKGSRGPTSSQKTLVEAAALFLKFKERDSSFHHFDSLRIRVNRFVEFCSQQQLLFVHEPTGSTVQSWIISCAVGRKTHNNYLGDIGNFFNWCTQVGQEWRPDNPVDKVSRRRVHRETPTVLTTLQLKTFLRGIEADYPQFALFYALCAFGGIRGDKRDGELKRLATFVARDGWAPYRGENTIIVPKPKVGSAREVVLQPHLQAWLKSYPELNVPTPWEHRMICKEFKLTQNVLRHTAISIFIGAGGTYGDAATCFGTSESMIRRHYFKRIDKTEAVAALLFPSASTCAST